MREAESEQGRTGQGRLIIARVRRTKWLCACGEVGLAVEFV